MKHFLTFIVFVVAVAGVLRADEPAAPSATDADKAAIEKAIASYVEAFNRGDAKALAAHWTGTGQFTLSDGKTLKGRAELEKEFASYFAKTEKARLELVETNIRFLSPDRAVETGVESVVLPDGTTSETRYEMVHLKTDAGWKIASVQEEDTPAAPPTHYEQLKNLEWMVGQWVDADENSSVTLNCRWTTNRNFIVRSFKVLIKDRLDMEGTQVIGWDPAAQTIRSWMFDSDGGFAVGRWTNDGNRWTVNTLSVLPDGRRASSTNIYEVLDDHSVCFQSIGRQVDGELLPNIEAVTLERTAEK